MRLSKLHGLGNDFLVLLDDESSDDEGCIAAGPGLTKSLCDRRTGVGADGLILSRRGDAGVTFELWNADGSVAEMSGNGVRCLALAARRAGWWDDISQPLRIATSVGERTVRWVSGADDAVMCSVDMGVVTERRGQWEDVLAHDDGASAERLDFAGVFAVDIGNPHVVVLLDGDRLPAQAEVEPDIAALERSFPGGVNVEYVVRGPGPGEVTMIVHERGAGWTQACGTGSCAVAHVARRVSWVGDEATVHNPGGSVTVTLDGDAARLTGPAVWIADLTPSGQWPFTARRVSQ